MRTLAFLPFLCVLLAHLGGPHEVCLSADSLDRASFASKLANAHVGDGQKRILEIVGEPDLVLRTDTDASLSYSDISEIWYYGVASENRFPTLGRIYFGAVESSGITRVERIYGKETPSLKVQQIDEDELRGLLALLGGLDGCNAAHYNPRNMIAAVNAFVKLKRKDVAIAVIEEYLRICPEDHDFVVEELLLFFRVVFELPCKAAFPACRLGEFQPPPPADESLCPRFPIHVVGDIPVLLVDGYRLEGEYPSVSEELDFFKRHGILRKAPLVPTSDPIRVMEVIKKQPAWAYRQRSDTDDIRLMRQFVALVGGAEVDGQVPHLGLSGRESIEDFQKKIAELKRKRFTWVLGRSQYQVKNDN